MRSYLFASQVILITCFLFLSLVACTPEPETVVPATAPPAEALPSSPTTVSTPTPFPTATNAPTATPTLTTDPFQESATASPQTITVDALAEPAFPNDIEISLVAPQPGAYIPGGYPEQAFSWTYQGLLPDDWHFEIRFYKAGEPGFQAPFGWMKETSRTINLNNLSSGGDYEWNVVIIQGVDGRLESEIYQSPRRNLKWEG